MHRFGEGHSNARSPTAPGSVAGRQPDTIGPYQVIRSLGAGGMGEVLLARDPRLGREVAIKRIRSEKSDEQTRARFQREARLAATFNHSAIVQIYDLLVEDGAEHIVMEYVAGRSLRDLLDERGPLPPSEALSIARSLAEGLAYAHAHGVIHRDLKTENVLLSAEGQAKITDFGIARRVPTGDAGAGREETLTNQGAVLGTCRAMSPEQVSGDPLDARSDLFAFGTLLYETFTGHSPFLATTNRETLYRILNHSSPPAVELVPALPEELSDLIGRLHAKAPELRPRDAQEVARFLAVLEQQAEEVAAATRELTSTGLPETSKSGTGLTGLILLRGQRRAAVIALVAILILVAAWSWVRTQRVDAPTSTPPSVRQRSVAVLRPEIEVGMSESSRMLAFTVRRSLLHGFASFEAMEAESQHEVDAIGRSPTEVARAVVADEVLSVTLACTALECVIDLDRIDGKAGTVITSHRFQLAPSALVAATKAARVALRQLYPDEPWRDDVRELEATPDEFGSYMRILQAWNAKTGSLETATLLADLEALRRRAPTFLEVLLLEAEIAIERFLETDDDAFRRQAYDRIEEAERLHAGSTEVLQRKLFVEQRAGDLQAAVETLGKLAELMPGHVWILDNESLVLEKQGHLLKALERAEAAVRRRPSIRRLYRQAVLAKDAGAISKARKSLEQLLALSPEDVRGISVLAQLELTYGDPRRTVEILSPRVAREPATWQLTSLSLAYLLLRDFAASARASEQALALKPRNPTYMLNLADAYWLDGHREEALAFYRQVLEVTGDPGDDPKKLMRCAQALAHLGETHGAVEAAQEALRLVPEDAEILFSAALVYTVVGDWTAAEVNTRRVLALGYAPRWFELSWFDELRARPTFAKLVDEGTNPEGDPELP